MLFGKKRKQHHANLIEWQNAVMETKSDKLYCKEAQLREVTVAAAQNDQRIMQDCVSIMQSTVKPDVYFSRLDLLISTAEHAKSIGKYLECSGATPDEVYDNIIHDAPEATSEFVTRYWIDVKQKADALKTEKGRLNRYQKAYDGLKPYYDILAMNDIGFNENQFELLTGQRVERYHRDK